MKKRGPPKRNNNEEKFNGILSNYNNESKITEIIKKSKKLLSPDRKKLQDNSKVPPL